MSLDPDDEFGNSPIPNFPNDQDTARAWVRGSLEEYRCPFAWLLGEAITPIFD